MKKSRRTLPWAALLAAAGLSWAAPAAAQTPPPAVEQEPAASSHESGQYRLQRGDQLSVKLFYHPSLNEDVTVRPDGRISLQLVDELDVVGMTPRELAAQLKARYSEKLESPEVAVIVKTFAAQRIFVAGEVLAPGEYPLVGGTTALQAIALARGLKDSARLTEVVILRRSADARPQVTTVNLKQVVEGRARADEVLLQPYDVVWVPRSRIANVNKFVKEFIVNNIPVDFGIRFDLVP